MWLLVPLLNTQLFWSLMKMTSKNHGEFKMEVGVGSSTNISSSLYTVQEILSIERFRNLVKHELERDYEYSDEFLMRFLRAQEMNLHAAKEMLSQMKSLRRKNNLDSILNETIEHFYPQMCWLDEGVDKDGSPIIYYRLEGMDIRKLLLKGLRSNITRRLYKCLEQGVLRLRELSKSSGKLYDAGIAIIDVEGYNLKQHNCLRCIHLALEVLQDAQLLIPGQIKLLVMVNAPVVIKYLHDFLKPFMTKAMKNVVHIFGLDKNEWISFLKQYISSDQLVKEFGGLKESNVHQFLN